MIQPYIYQLLQQLVQAQKGRDDRITQLVDTMRPTYSTVIGSESLQEDKLLQNVVDRILKQTVGCGFFIQNRTRRSFTGQ